MRNKLKNLTFYAATTPTKQAFQFLRNQCVAWSKTLSDQCHPVLLFVLAGKYTAAKFQ